MIPTKKSVLLVAFGLIAIAFMSVPVASADMSCAGVACAGTTPSGGPVVCRYLGTGTYDYYCVGYDRGCIYEWRDQEPDGNPRDTDSMIVTVICL